MSGERGIGHGAHGIRDGLRSFSDLARAGASAKRAYCELQAGRRVHTFYLAGATSYVAAYQPVFDGVILDVTGVLYTGGSLTRVQSAALCDTTAGTYFYDANVPKTQPKWDIDFDFDLGDRWDSSPQLYVHLPGEADPNLASVVALSTFIFGVAGEVVPTLGPIMNLDPGLELWNTPTELTVWHEDTSVAANREDTIKRGGAYSVRLEASGFVPVGSAGGFSSESLLTGVAGATYLLDFDYRTHGLGPSSSMAAQIRVSAVGIGTYEANGRDTNITGAGIDLAPTGDEWRRGTFYFLQSVDAPLQIAFHLMNKSGLIPGVAGYFDNVRLRRVYGWNYVEPRLSPQGLPALTASATSVTFGSQTMGAGNITLLNGGDDYFERLLSTFDVCSRNVKVRYGGMFEDGQEVTYDETRVGWTAVLEDFEGNADQVTLRVPSLRSILATSIPPSKYDRLIFPGIAEADLDRPRPIVVGTVTGVRPARIEIQAAGALGPEMAVYELLDPTFAAGDRIAFANPSAVYAYEDADAAEARDTTRRALLVPDRDYRVTTESYRTTGRITMLRNPGPVRIVAGLNDALDFDNGGPPLAAFLTPGLYAWEDLIAAIGALMTATAGTLHVGTYNMGTYPALPYHRVILNGPPTFNLYLASGTNKARSAWSTIGFGQTTDLTGAPGYLGSVTIAHNPDKQHIRFDHTGYADDSAGTFTGSAYGLIEKPSDVARFLMRKVGQIPVELIDVDSFVAARVTSPQRCGVYLGGTITMTLGAALDAIEFSGYGDIVSDAEGRFRWVPRIDDVPGYAASVATKVFDHELLGLTWSRSLEDTLHKIQVRFARDPVSGKFRVYEQTNIEVPTRYSRTDARTFDTWLVADGDASTLAVKLARICTRPLNQYVLTLKGALMDVLLSDIIDVSELRRKLLDYEDAHEPFMLRVKSYRVDFLAHVVEVVGYSYYFGLPPL